MRAHFGLPSVLVTNDFEKAFDLLERGTFCSAAEGLFGCCGVYIAITLLFGRRWAD